VQEFKKNTEKQSFKVTDKRSTDAIIKLNMYIEAHHHLLSDSSLRIEKNESISQFMDHLLDMRKYHINLESSIEDLFQCLDSSTKEEILLEFIAILDKLNEKLWHYKDESFMVLQKLHSDFPSDRLTKQICLSFGKLGTKYRSLSSRCINEIRMILDSDFSESIQLYALQSLSLISYSWPKQKNVFGPLLKIIQEGSKNTRIDAIKLIKMQLEGYWEKPVESLMSIVRNEHEDSDVRQESIISLGDAAEFGGTSIQDAIYELATELGNKIIIQKKALKNVSEEDHEHLSQNKVLIKLLYHYIKLYQNKLHR
jgi:hypothetical protein